MENVSEFLYLNNLDALCAHFCLLELLTADYALYTEHKVADNSLGVKLEVNDKKSLATAFSSDLNVLIYSLLFHYS